MTEPATTERDRDRRDWRLAAILFIGGGLGAAPADALYRPAHEPTIYLLPLLAIVSGLVCWLLADRLSGEWLHLMTAVATVEIAITVWLADEVFSIFYVFVAVYAAFVFRDRRAIAAQIGFASLAVLAPLAYDPDSSRETLIEAFVLIPTLAIAGAAIAFLRERLESSEDSYRRLAERDPLTGVGNYRILSERLPLELQRHSRYEHPLALVVIDLDNFKLVNDNHGHLTGDRVLQEVAGALMGTVRSHDIVVRHGGDEFCVIAPETDRAAAEDLARRLRDAITALSEPEREMGACTGIAVFPEEGTSLNDLLAAADEQLRTSKDAKPSLARSSA